MNVDNCPNCGKIYTKNFRNLCTQCIKEYDQKCDQCAQFLRKNRMVTIDQLSKETKIPVSLITRFIREGKLVITNNPSMSYNCESCNKLIRNGHLCQDCRNRLTRSLQTNQTTEPKTEIEKPPSSTATYKIKKDFRER